MNKPNNVILIERVYAGSIEVGMIGGMGILPPLYAASIPTASNFVTDSNPLRLHHNMKQVAQEMGYHLCTDKETAQDCADMALAEVFGEDF